MRKKNKNKTILKYKGLTGYKLHRKRLNTTKGKAIRTIKYPLKADQQLLNNLIEDIKHDYEAQVGALNITTYQDNSKKYSLLDFYLDLLRAGFIFASSGTKLKTTLNRYQGKEKQKDERIKEHMRKKDKEFLELLDFKTFKEKIILSKGDLRGKKEEKFFIGNYKKNKENYDKKEEIGEKIKSIEGETGIFNADCYFKDGGKINKYVKSILEEINTDKKQKEEKKKFWEDNFGVIFDDKDNKESKEEKLTLCPLPSLEIKEDLPSDELLDRLLNEDKIKKEFSSKKEQQAILGLTESYNAFSYCFNKFFNALYEKEIDKLVNNIVAVTGTLWQGEEKELRKRIEWIAQKAHQLPKKPRMTNSWAEYRSSLGGKISSWFTNSNNQDEEIKKTLEGQQEQLRKLEEELMNVKDEARRERKEEIYQIIKDLLEKNQQLLVDKRISEAELELYEDILKELRLKLNQDIQKSNPDLEEKDYKKKRDKYKRIFETLRAVPKFVGEHKKQQMKKYMTSATRWKRGVEGLTKLSEQLQQGELNCEKVEDKDVRRIKRTLDNLRFLYQQEQSTPWCQHIIKSAIKLYYAGDFTELKPNQFFDTYKRRGNVTEISLLKKDEEVLNSVSHFITKLRPEMDKRDVKTNIQECLNAVELMKMWVGLVTFFSNISIRKEELKELFPAEHFPKYEAGLRLTEKSELSGEALGNLLQRGVFSELRGTLNKLTQEESINRYVAQFINSEKRWPLVFRKEEKKNNWSIVRKEKIKEGAKVKMLTEKKISDDKKSWKEEKINKEAMFKIVSSKYQLQFLNESSPFYAKAHQDKMEVEISEYTFIAEETIKAYWEGDERRVKKIEQKDEKKKLSKVFVSIPLSWKATNESHLDKRTTYLGIDVGEYGLAYSLVDIREKKIIKQCFVFDSTIKAIRENYKINQKAQVIGVFGTPVTKVAELRENAIGKLRNRTHDLAVRYNAVPSYEFNISNFETRSGKITKIYDSIKRADTQKENNDAEKQTREHIWGRKFLVGKHKSAFATSYCCTKCWDSIHTQLHSQSENKFKVKKQSDRYGIIELANGNAYAYFDKGVKKEEISEKEALTAIKAYSRPPLFKAQEATKEDKEKIHKLNNEVIEKHPTLSEKIIFNYASEKEWLKFRERSGGQAVFICPFTDCNHISDADIQASVIIGLRAWYKDEESKINKGKKKEKNKEETSEKKNNLKQELEHYKSMNLPPTPLKVALRLQPSLNPSN